MNASELSKRLQEKIFKLIRPLFVDDIDPNEDFRCGHCGKPLLRRFLFCSKECAAHYGF